MLRSISIILLGLLWVIFSCEKITDLPIQEEPEGKKYPEKILFIGNSHTYYNGGIDLYLKGFVDANDTLSYTIIERSTKGGYRLSQHWSDESTKWNMEREEWDEFVLQENGYYAYSQPDSLLPIVRKFQNLTSKNDQELTLFMTWAYRDSAYMLDNISKCYEETSNSLQVDLVHAGYAFRDCLAEHPEISLHNPDGFHPDTTGTFLSAALFYTHFYKANPIENSYKPENMPDSIANILKEEAWEAYLKYQ